MGLKRRLIVLDWCMVLNDDIVGFFFCLFTFCFSWIEDAALLLFVFK